MAEPMEVKIGVLALQGDFAEHVATLQHCGPGIIASEVRTVKELEGLHGLIIPGGESTVIVKLLVEFGMFDAVKGFGATGYPMLGTCAGCIMMADSIDGMPDQKTLQLADYSVCRNAYGRQVDSFEAKVVGDKEVFGDEPVNAVLIRAPMITRAGGATRVLASHNDHPILLQQGGILSCTFHPEICGDPRIHQYFVGMVRKHGKPYSGGK